MEKENIHNSKMCGLIGRRTRNLDNLDDILGGLSARMTGTDYEDAAEAFRSLKELAEQWPIITEYPVRTFPWNLEVLGHEYINLYKNRAETGRGDILAVFFGLHMIIVRIGGLEEGFPGVWITYRGMSDRTSSVAQVDFPLHTCYTTSQYIFNAMLLKKEDSMGKMLNLILQEELDRRGDNIYKEELSWA